MRKRKIVLLAVSTVLFCLATSGQLANASYEKPKSPVPPPETEAGRKRAKIRVLKKMYFFVTAYYGPRLGQKKYALGSFKKDVRMNGAGKETRSGTVPDIGTAAADWRVLRKGTKFRILECNVKLGSESPKPASDIIFTVLDTGGGVKGRHVDIYAGTGDAGCEIARNFDCKKYVIEIVECQP